MRLILVNSCAVCRRVLRREYESSPLKGRSAVLHFFCLSGSTSNASYLYLHHMLVFEHSIVVSIKYRCGPGFIKALTIPQTPPCSNELFGSQLTATDSLVLMTRCIRKKGDKTKIKFLFQWPHHTACPVPYEHNHSSFFIRLC